MDVFPSWWIKLGRWLLTGSAVVVLVVLSTAGVVQFTRAPGSAVERLAAVFSLSRETIAVRASPATVPSGSQIEISWRHEGATGGESYELLLPCHEGLAFATSSDHGFVCGAPFRLSGPEGMLMIVPTLAGTTSASLEIPVTVQAKRSGEVTVSGSRSVTVIPPIGVQPSPSSSSGNASPSSRSVRPRTLGSSATAIIPLPATGGPVLAGGVPDLAIRVVAVGTINPADGQFAATSSVRRLDEAAVVFEVTNQGGAASLPWQFSARIPVFNGFFDSQTQPPLASGDGVRFTLGFKNVERQGANGVVLTLDPHNALRDADRANDIATATIFRLD